MNFCSSYFHWAALFPVPVGPRCLAREHNLILSGFQTDYIKLGIVFTRAAPTFDNLFKGRVFNINTLHKTVEKLKFQAFY